MYDYLAEHESLSQAEQKLKKKHTQNNRKRNCRVTRMHYCARFQTNSLEIYIQNSQIFGRTRQLCCMRPNDRSFG